MEDWNKSSGGRRRTKNVCSLSFCSSSVIQCNLNLSNLMLYSSNFIVLFAFICMCMYCIRMYI
jgi:hypothetical protein